MNSVRAFYYIITARTFVNPYNQFFVVLVLSATVLVLVIDLNAVIEYL
jgi:hypothetical protein